MLSQQDLDAAPKITLGSKEFAIPKLVPRQNRIVIPKLMAIMTEFTSSGDKFDPTTITTRQYDELCDITHMALTRGYPDLTRDEFMDMDMDTFDLVRGLDVISDATGLIKRAAPGAEAPPAGEV